MARSTQLSLLVQFVSSCSALHLSPPWCSATQSGGPQLGATCSAAVGPSHMLHSSVPEKGSPDPHCLQACFHLKTGPAPAVPTATGRAAAHATSATPPSLARLTPTEKALALVSRYCLNASLQSGCPSCMAEEEEEEERCVCLCLPLGLMACVNYRNDVISAEQSSSAQHNCVKLDFTVPSQGLW